MGRYCIREVTPEDMRCIIGSCPAVYEVTPEDMRCGLGACPAAYRTGKSYLIIGKTVEAGDFGLEGKVGDSEALILVDKKLIDKIGR